MLLHDIAPSLNFALAESQTVPAKRLTVLLGAGASMYAGAPSTDALTKIIAARPCGGSILRALKRAGEANFEDVFEVLQQLEAFKATFPDRAPASLLPFVHVLDAIEGQSLDRAVLRREYFEVMEAIADVFRKVRYDTAWPTLANVLAVFLEAFNLDVFTLNYDLLADVAVEGLSRTSGKQWFNGFESTVKGVDATFNPAQYASWNPEWGPRYLTLQHLHGSLRYVYGEGFRFAHTRRFTLEEAYANFDDVCANWGRFKDLALRYPDETFSGISPIISGLHKLEKLNVQPYANYYAAFARAISESEYLLIIGYGKGDDHINYWVQEFAQIHNQTARVVEITNSDDPSTFAVQRITEWPDLNWHALPGQPQIFESSAGIENLVFTSGLSEDIVFPLLLREFALPLYAK